MNEILLGATLLLTTAVSTLLSLSVGTRKKRLLRACAVISFLVGAIVLLNGFLTKKSNSERATLQEISGALQPGHQATPNLTCDVVILKTNKLDLFRLPPTNEIAVFLGTNVVVSTLDSNFAVFRVYGSNLLSVRRSNNQAFISAEIRSEDGRYIAQIKDNEFHVNPANHFYIKRPDRYRLMVYEQSGGCVLNVNFLNPLAIRVTGVFRTSGKEAVMVAEDKVEFAKIHLYGFAFHLRDKPLFEWPTPSTHGQSVWIFDKENNPVMVVSESGGKIDAQFTTVIYRDPPTRVMTGDIMKCSACGKYFDQCELGVSNFHARPFPH